MPSISGSIFNLIIAIMRKVKVSWFLAVPTIYLLSCISAPISYDTAEIPNYHERIKVGLEDKYHMEITSSPPLPCFLIRRCIQHTSEITNLGWIFSGDMG